MKTIAIFLGPQPVWLAETTTFIILTHKFTNGTVTFNKELAIKSHTDSSKQPGEFLNNLTVIYQFHRKACIKIH